MTSHAPPNDLVDVVVVDDRPAEQETIRLLLTENGFNPLFYVDYRPAYEAIVAQQAQRLLVNYQLGGAKRNLGAALLKKLQDKGPAVPTIVINCRSSNRQAVSTHCDEFDFVLRIIESGEIHTQTSAIRNAFRRGTIYHITSKIERPTVFIIHGRHVEAVSAGTETAVERFSRVLKVSLGVEIVVLSGEPYTGETLIQQIERHFKESAIAVALFTADDVGCLKGEAKLEPRVRQNVLYETGFARGYLGPQRTIVFLDDTVKLPSDLGGLRTLDINLDDKDLKIVMKQIFDVLKLNAPLKAI